MNELNTHAVDVLTDLLRSAGSHVAEDRALLKIMYADVLRGTHREEFDLLLIAERYGVVRDLVSLGSGCNTASLEALTQQLQHRTKYLTLEAAHFAVHGWSYALTNSNQPKGMVAKAGKVIGTRQQQTLFATALCCLASIGLIFSLGPRQEIDQVVELSKEVTDIPLPPKKVSPAPVIKKKVEQQPIIAQPQVASTVVPQALSVAKATVIQQSTKVAPPVHVTPLPQEQVTPTPQEVVQLHQQYLKEQKRRKRKAETIVASKAAQQPDPFCPPVEIPTVRVASKPVVAPPRIATFASWDGARHEITGSTYEYPRLTIGHDGHVTLLERFPLSLDANSKTFRGISEWSQPPAWVRFGSQAIGMLTETNVDDHDELFEVTLYYAHQNYRFVECYTGFRFEGTLFRLQWAYEQLPGRDGSWYYLGKHRSYVNRKQQAYFANNGHHSRDRQYKLIQMLYDPKLPARLVQKINQSTPRTITAAK